MKKSLFAIRAFFPFLLFLLTVQSARAQQVPVAQHSPAMHKVRLVPPEAPFSDEINAFLKDDSINPPPQHAIVFAGSSSFRKWTDLADYFPGYTVLNRGFGGSSLPDLTRYAGRIILPYHPRQVVIYCGDNDLASSDSITANIVYKRFRKLFALIRAGNKSANILYVSIKPSPSRMRLMPQMEAANKKIRFFLGQQKNARFVDVYHLMLDASGKPVETLFLEDRLHMNPDGYAIWQKAIQPLLIKD